METVWITAPPACSRRGWRRCGSQRRPLLLLVLDQVEGRRAGRNHREALLARVDAGVDDRRASGGERLLERRLELLLGGDRVADGAVGLGEPRVVRDLVRQV